MTLTDVRLRAGMTVAALAREARIDRKTIDRAEKGEVISLVKAYAIANAISRITGVQYSYEELEIQAS